MPERQNGIVIGDDPLCNIGAANALGMASFHIDHRRAGGSLLEVLPRLAAMPQAPHELAQWLHLDALRMQSLRAVRDIMGEGAWLAAGFIRNLVWDKQHGHTDATPLDDLDVIYLDAANLGLHAEAHWQTRLQQQLALPWQVRNQARMAQRHGHCPYLDCADAIARWPETATCYAVQLDDADQLH